MERTSNYSNGLTLLRFLLQVSRDSLHVLSLKLTTTWKMMYDAAFKPNQKNISINSQNTVIVC